jgi:LysR family transcriptional regulator, glycine cleavage system transcriptional activator
MTRRLPSLNGLRVFDAAVRHMSFTLAAQELHITQGGVSRAIRALEDDLGFRLFNRLPRRLQLTEEARILSASVREALDTIERVALRLGTRGSSRILTIDVLPTFAAKWLMPRLVEFNELNPSFEVRLVTSIRPVDFERDDVDVAIRVGRLEAAGRGDDQRAPRIDLSMAENLNGIRAEEILPDKLIPVTAPHVLNGRKLLRDVEELSGFTLLHTATRQNAWPDWLRLAKAAGVDGRRGPSFGHFFLTLQAAMNGQGIALVPEVLALADISAGKLVVAIDRPIAKAGSYYLLSRRHHWDAPKVRLFREWLKHACDRCRINERSLNKS